MSNKLSHPSFVVGLDDAGAVIPVLSWPREGQLGVKYQGQEGMNNRKTCKDSCEIWIARMVTLDIKKVNIHQTSISLHIKI